MAFNDALFQLGMDLARSSTTQTEDLVACASRSATEVRKDFFVDRQEAFYAGSHLIIDLYGASRLDDQGHIERTLKQCVHEAGASLLHIHTHRLPQNGVAGVAVLAESHISAHTWPDRGYAAFDVFMCGGANPHVVVDILREAFAAGKVTVTEHRRGAKRKRAGKSVAAKPMQRLGTSAERVRSAA